MNGTRTYGAMNGIRIFRTMNGTRECLLLSVTANWKVILQSTEYIDDEWNPHVSNKGSKPSVTSATCTQPPTAKSEGRQVRGNAADKSRY